MFEAPLPFVFIEGSFRHWRTGSSLRRRHILVVGTRRTQRITGSAFRISFHPDWQIDNGFFNRPIMTRTKILVLTGGVPEPRFRRRYLVDGLNQSFKFRLWRRLNWVEPPSPSPYAFLCLKKKSESPIKEKKHTACWCFCLIIISLASPRVSEHIRDFSSLSRALNLKPHLQKYIR